MVSAPMSTPKPSHPDPVPRYNLRDRFGSPAVTMTLLWGHHNPSHLDEPPKPRSTSTNTPHLERSPLASSGPEWAQVSIMSWRITSQSCSSMALTLKSPDRQKSWRQQCCVPLSCSCLAASGSALHSWLCLSHCLYLNLGVSPFSPLGGSCGSGVRPEQHFHGQGLVSQSLIPD